MLPTNKMTVSVTVLTLLMIALEEREILLAQKWENWEGCKSHKCQEKWKSISIFFLWKWRIFLCLICKTSVSKEFDCEKSIITQTQPYGHVQPFATYSTSEPEKPSLCLPEIIHHSWCSHPGMTCWISTGSFCLLSPLYPQITKNGMSVHH